MARGMAGEHEKAGLKARLGAYWTRLGVYQEKKLEPARGVSRVRLGLYLGEVHAVMRLPA